MDDLKTIFKGSYKPQREFAEDISKIGYDYDPELSSMENKVFVSRETGEKRIQLADKVKAKYGEVDTIYGDSRGGFLAEKAGERTGAKVVTYNKATLPQDIFKSIRPEQTDIRVKGDVVSLPSFLQSGGTKVERLNPSIFANELTAHSIV